MSLPSEVINKIIFRLGKVDKNIDAAKAASAQMDATGTLGYIREAEHNKRSVINLLPEYFRGIYDIFYFLDLAADTATSYPDGAISQGVTIDELIENLEQSLEDLGFLIEEGEDDIFKDLVRWLRTMIEYLKKHREPDADSDPGHVRFQKWEYFHGLDPTDELGTLFDGIEGIDRDLYIARRRLERVPPDFPGASGFLSSAEDKKHSLIDYLRERDKKGDGLPEPGAPDLPKHPDHA